MDQNYQDIFYIKRTFELAKMGEGFVSPNPMVGCVITKDGEVISEGHHSMFGMAHAEADAINKTKADLSGSTLYCNLEPCCHTNKKTPPCVDLLIEKKISKVVICNLDPNPEVSGKGIEKLRDNGVEVVSGVLEEEGKILNEAFFKSILTKKPYVIIKLAQTLDGKMATLSGDSKWITSEDTRTDVHKLRYSVDAVLVGRKTLNSDNPSLTIRMGLDSKGKVPYRIVIGNPNLMNLDSKLFTDPDRDRSLVISTINRTKIKKEVLEAFDEIELIDAPLTNEKLDWDLLLKFLYLKGIGSLLIEGGSKIIDGIVKQERWDKALFYIAPKILGEGKTYLDKEVNLISESIDLKKTNFKTFEKDVCVIGYRE